MTGFPMSSMRGVGIFSGIAHYNIKACLLDRSPVPSMDLKSNKSGL